MKHFLKMIGLHPIVALSMIIIDIMLFGSDITGVGWGVSVMVAAVLTIPCILFQYHFYKDSLPIAIAKGLLVGLITAIPTAIPSIITGGWGIIGTLALRLKDNDKDSG